MATIDATYPARDSSSCLKARGGGPRNRNIPDQSCLCSHHRQTRTRSNSDATFGSIKNAFRGEAEAVAMSWSLESARAFEHNPELRFVSCENFQTLFDISKQLGFDQNGLRLLQQNFIQGQIYEKR